MKMNTYELAQSLIKQGFYVFPSRSKADHITDWPNAATRDPEQIKKWFGPGGTHEAWNISIYTGKYGDNEALVAVDVDPQNKGVETYTALHAQHPFTQTRQHDTPSGGTHLLYSMPRPGLKSGTHVLGPGIDIRSAGGLIHFGDGYALAEDAPVAPVPAWIIEMCTPAKATTKPADKVVPADVDQSRAEKRAEFYLLTEAPLAIEGSGGDETTYKVAARCKDFGLSEDQTLALLAEKWNPRCQPVWPIEDLRKKIANAFSYGVEAIGAMAPEVQFPPLEIDEADDTTKYCFKKDWSDTGNANVLIAEAKGNLRYVYETGTWLYWTGRHWREDPTQHKAMRAALKVPEQYRAEIERRKAALPTFAGENRKVEEKAIANLESWERTCRNRNGTGGLMNMLAMAKTDSRVVLQLEQLDDSRHLLGVRNGVVDLRIGKLCDAPRDAYVTKQSPFKFDPDAKAPLWERVIAEITGVPGRSKDDWTPQPDMAAYLHRVLGYLITGETREHRLFIWSGDGANGKSLLVDVGLTVFGDYATVTSPELLIQPSFTGDAERATPGIAALVGKRAAFCSEGRTGQKLDLGVIKRHTGDERLNARQLHGKFFTFRITHKLTYLTNIVPDLEHIDEAIVSRLHVLPFLRTWNRPGHADPNPQFPDGDPDLKEKLLAEGEGILARIIAESVAYYQHGLIPPPQVRSKTMGYVQAQDGMGQWIREACERRTEAQGEWTLAKDALSHYNAFAGLNGYVTMNPKTFAAGLARHHIPQRKTRKGAQYAIKIVVDETREFQMATAESLFE
jgi:P4 family phage/plasmid primase-like protien